MAKIEKTYKIEKSSCGLYSTKTRYYYFEGTLPELIKACSYTLECGQSWEHERGRKKINCNPKTIAALCTQLYNASNNSAADGYSGNSYRVMAEGEQEKSNS